MKSLVAPWPDFAGNSIHQGDRLVHPTGESFVAVRLDGWEQETDAWRAVYDDATVSRLCLQLGDRGCAVVAGSSALPIGLAVQVRKAQTEIASWPNDIREQHGLKPRNKFSVDQRVRKVTGEYRISGEVRSVFTKADGTVRLVVEHTAEGGGSFLHIYGEANLEAE